MSIYKTWIRSPSGMVDTSIKEWKTKPKVNDNTPFGVIIKVRAASGKEISELKEAI